MYLQSRRTALVRQTVLDVEGTAVDLAVLVTDARRRFRVETG